MEKYTQNFKQLPLNLVFGSSQRKCRKEREKPVVNLAGKSQDGGKRRNSLREVQGDGNEWACRAHPMYPKREERG